MMRVVRLLPRSRTRLYRGARAHDAMNPRLSHAAARDLHLANLAHGQVVGLSIAATDQPKHLL